MEWLANYFAPYLVPILVQGMTPVVVGYMKKAADYLDRKLPHAVVVTLAGVVAEGVNAAQAYFTGNPLPYGLGGVVGILMRELKQDFARISTN